MGAQLLAMALVNVSWMTYDSKRADSPGNFWTDIDGFHTENDSRLWLFLFKRKKNTISLDSKILVVRCCWYIFEYEIGLTLFGIIHCCP